MNKFTTVFVLGGPGSGKGTQSQLIQNTYKFIHLSAGELLRNQQQRQGSQYGEIIEKIILEGKIVPSHITVSLLHSAMREKAHQSRNFLIDGFPRNIQNYTAWKQSSSQLAECPFVLHFKCSEKQMIKRLLKRAESSNRSDDNLQVIKKRFNTYYTQTQQVLKKFEEDTKVLHIDSDPSEDQIFENVKPYFQKLLAEKNLL